MITEKATIKCEAIFSDDRLHRLLWRRVWDKDKVNYNDTYTRPLEGLK